MTTIQKKSGILPWSIDDIIVASSGPGVYVLRDSTPIEGIIYIGSAEKLKERLKEHFLSKDILGVLFFDWYETSGINEARELEKKWIKEYQPKFNIQNI
jgi:excinuclease UvrABC nuclease subunit